MDYQAELAIDKYNLDVELVEQPGRFLRFARLLAFAERKVRQAEEDVKVTRSQLIFKAHTKGEAVLGRNVKVQGQTVEAYYRLDAKYIRAKDVLDKALYKRDIYLAAVQAFRQRKDALQELARLQSQEYYSKPNVNMKDGTIDLLTRMDKRKQEKTERTHKRMRRDMKGGK